MKTLDITLRVEVDDDITVEQAIIKAEVMRDCVNVTLHLPEPEKAKLVNIWLGDKK